MPGDVTEWADSVTGHECHACSGKGIVWGPEPDYHVVEPVFRHDLHAAGCCRVDDPALAPTFKLSGPATGLKDS